MSIEKDTPEWTQMQTGMLARLRPHPCTVQTRSVVCLAVPSFVKIASAGTLRERHVVFARSLRSSHMAGVVLAFRGLKR